MPCPGCSAEAIENVAIGDRIPVQVTAQRRRETEMRNFERAERAKRARLVERAEWEARRQELREEERISKRNLKL
ncbi:hypothetical protein BCON_0023g00570 [Botryotinia convoluta]|uniref:Uncharacterized protein n=1 Tax=Botryotinia convoluta TaxID=54673 RepID=A0A4Z1IZE1_9HELO|nr:hypothetical protein BCON_0023g00570 [Botryotinia convoluta]